MGCGGANLGKAMKGAARRKSRSGSRGKGAGRADAAMLARREAAKETNYLKELAEAAKRALRDHLLKERQMTIVNRKKVETAWLRIMRMAKVEELKKDIEIIAQNHEREVDRRDALLQMLDRDLDEAEEQFQTAMRNHLQNLDRLIELQDERLHGLEQKFEEALEEVQQEYTLQRIQLEDDHVRTVHEIVTLIDTIKEEEEDKAAEARHEYETQREELRNRSIERIQELSRLLDDEISDLEGEFESAHLTYLQNTDTKTEEFKKLTLCDQKATKEIERKMRQIDRLQAQLASWRAKMSANARDYSDRNELLRKERDHMASYVDTLKNQMNKKRQGAAQRLQAMTKSAQQAKTRMANNLRVAERVLQLSERARQHMNEEEKIFPFGRTERSTTTTDVVTRTGGFQRVEDNEATFQQQRATSAKGGRERFTEMAMATAQQTRQITQEVRSRLGSRNHSRGLSNSHSTTHDINRQDYNEFQSGTRQSAVDTKEDASGLEEISPIKEITDKGAIEQLENVHQMYNRTLMDQMALEQEQLRLEQENEDLQSLLQQYMDGMAVRSDALSDDNPLMVVNGRSGTTAQIPVRPRSTAPTMIEGAQALNKSGMHTIPRAR